MKRLLSIGLLFLTIAFVCCKKEKQYIKSEKGGIDIITNIYFDASKGLDNTKHILLSKINYKNDSIVELIPNVEYPEFVDGVVIIKDSLYQEYENNFSNILFADLKKGKKVTDKKFGSMWSDKPIPNFDKREDLNDTVLFKKNFKRFKIDSKDHFSIYYINQTDTLFPYQVYPVESKSYGGRLERIDTYNRKDDMFITIQLLPRKEWDNEAKEIFEYNNFVGKRIKK